MYNVKLAMNAVPSPPVFNVQEKNPVPQNTALEERLLQAGGYLEQQKIAKHLQELEHGLKIAMRQGTDREAYKELDSLLKMVLAAQAVLVRLPANQMPQTPRVLD